MKLPEAARMLGISTHTMYKMTSTNKIPFYRPAGVIYFKVSELEEWIEKSRVSSNEEIQGMVELYCKDRK